MTKKTENKELRELSNWKCQECGSTKKSTYKALCENCYKRKKRRENPEPYRERNRQWISKNRERKRSADRKRYNEHKEEQRARSKIWGKNNKEKKAVYNVEYTKQRYSTDSEFRKKFNIRARTRQKFRKEKICSNCGVNKNLEFHHPNYGEENRVVTVCRKCHLKIHND